MITVSLPDGQTKTFPAPLTVLQMAESISPSLAKKAIAAHINAQTLVDTSFLVTHDVSLKILTEENAESLDILRHSCAHLLAHAVKQLYPDAQISTGPVIENGFYYDIAFKNPLTEQDLLHLEKVMKKLAAQRIKIERREVSKKEALDFFRQKNEGYKLKLINKLPDHEMLSLYQQGDFTDLCRGPHITHTGQLKAFRLTKLAGAYFQNDSTQPMLTRIYGTAWRNTDELNHYLEQCEEAERRDHRKLGKQLDLFHFEENTPGMVFWHPNGWRIYQRIESYLRKVLGENGYQEVRTPQLVDIRLWQNSGHCDKFGDDMFTLKTADQKHFAIKPMNCPCHVQIFNQGLKSYRDLPLRLAEFGACHRHEASGALHGLMRTRQFTQDDAHIFCTEDQIIAETHAFIDLLFKVYTDFGFEKKDLTIKLSTRPDKRVGSDQTWDKAEKALRDTLHQKNIDFQIMPGDGAFYGPKIEFVLKDALSRQWTTGTVQLDFLMPERLGATYIDPHGLRKTPVMLHRAIVGSLERFMAILLEHYADSLPVWLSPVQAMVLTITDKQNDYAQHIAQQFKENGVWAEVDLRNEKIGFKIREHTLKKIPYLLIVGEKEKAHQTLAVRTLKNKNPDVIDNMSFNDVLTLIQKNLGGLYH